MSYVNWLMKAKKNLSEYCLFYIKTTYFILHFEYNLTSEGWDLDAKYFKSFAQKVLYDKGFHIDHFQIKKIIVGNLPISNHYGNASPLYEALLEIQDWRTPKIKSIMSREKQTQIESITELNDNNLIFPYPKLKNLGLQEKLYLILPDLNREQIDKLVKIFSFFNYVFFNEIEGDFFLYGFEENVTFENGLFIKLFLPINTEISEFQQVFDIVFQCLKIKKYLILTDMIKGTNLLKSIFGNLDFLDSYNPLKNLKWNEKDKIWMNSKLFDENFNPIYPKLVDEEK